ncbi:Ig-like domain-containing protein [Anaerocolumna chitinilytica]|uniref:BIG2 domain-containing protein n=1 Tax=Anaerocolumna chitinilytica TaxID=1727145 RepID=A0A7I8DM25_9FIRM|nr:Ig-like domain-containing protein [Anaerocolumna chitinilytica]BCJ98331.1 hypothetical protein bsdcttw_13720 [Anaerocolumna chitinilytica]
MKKQKYIKRIIITLLIICFTAGSVTPIKADNAIVPISLELNKDWLNVPATQEQTTSYYKIVLPKAGRLKVEVRPNYKVECSFMKEDLSKVYFKTTYSKDYYKYLDSGEYDKLDAVFEAGTYYYTVAGASPNGEYAIKASFQPANNTEVEPNQTFEQAMKLTGGTVTGVISEDDEVDFYSVEVGKNQTFVVMPANYNKGDNSQGSSFSYGTFVIYDSNHQEIYKPYMLLKPVSFNWEEGTYYIKVAKGNGSSPSIYNFDCMLIDKGSDKVQYTYFDNLHQYMYMNSSVTVKPVVLPELQVNNKFLWKSSNTKVATVSQAGKVTGIKPGVTVITATSKDNPALSIYYNLTVQSISLTFEKYNVSLKTGKKYTIKPKMLIGASKRITYSSANSKVATVSKTGVVTAKKTGTVKIKAQANGLTKYITIKVTK